MENDAKILNSSLLIDGFFIEYITSPVLDVEFESLKHFLESSDQNIDSFLDGFLLTEFNPPSTERKSSIPRSPSSSGLKRTPIRRSSSSGINAIRLDTKVEPKIPAFFPQIIPQNSSSIISLYPPDEILKLPQIREIMRNHLNLPSFFALPFLILLDPSIGHSKKFEIPFSTLIKYVRENIEGTSLSQRIFRIIKGKNTNRNFLVTSDFLPFIACLVQTHPSLQFLEKDHELSSAYVRCIISRIFYSLDYEMRNRISYQHFEASNLPECLVAVDTAQDISDVSDYFSYEHFYVLYTYFYQMDQKDDGHPPISELIAYDNYRISPNLVRRLLNLFPSYNSNNHNDKKEQKKDFNFTDFIYFINAVEDKTTETALRLWFKVCDLDDDGIISIKEMKTLYKRQKGKMEDAGMDPVPFDMIFQQILDMMGQGVMLKMSQLRNSEHADTFFNILVDFKKFRDWEFRDPMYDNAMKASSTGMSQWDIFCQNEYERMSRENEETVNEEEE